MDRNNGGDPLAPPRPPKSQQPRVHQLSHHQQSSSSLHHRPRAPEPLPTTNNMSSSDQPPPRPPTQHPQQQQEPVLPLPPRVPKQQQHPLKPTVLHAAAQQPSHSPVVVQGTSPPTIAPLVPLQHQTQQQSSITFGRRSRASPVQQQQQPSSNNLSSATIQQPRSGSSPSPNRTFNPIGGAGVTQTAPAPIISSLTRNITNLSSNLISNLVSHSSSSSSAAPADTVTLAVPRPENERLTNEYVDTPFIQQQQRGVGVGVGGNGAHSNAPGHLLLHPQQHSTTTPQLSLRHNHPHSALNASSRTNGAVVTSQPTAGSHGPTARLLSDSAISPAMGHSPHGARKQLLGRHASNASQVITKQPTKDLKEATALHSIDKLDRAELSAHLIDGGVMGSAAGHTTSGLGGTAGGGAGLGTNGTPSITCPQCDKCRCEGCQKPRQLPSRWLCGKSCLCSAESVLDYATCLCCVKALFYHCSKDHEIDNENGNSISCADDPCSCLPHRRTTRWGCLGALSICLPCLVCYWPMRGAISMCAACYASQSRKGCRCNSNGKGRQHLQLQQQQHQMFGREGPMDELRASIGRSGGGNGGGMIPGGAKKVFPVDHHHETLNRKKLGEVLKRVDCDRAEEEDRLTATVGGGVQSGVIVGVLGGGGVGGAVDSESSSSCGGGNLVRTLRLKPTSTSSTSSSQLSLLRHPADETPPRHLLD